MLHEIESHSSKGRVPVQITIDSSDAIEDALRLVGAMYGVTLGVTTAEPAEEAGTATSAPSETERASSVSAPTKPRRSRGSGSKRSTPLDMAVVRAWAREHGLQVSDRGRLSTSVLQAYRNDLASA